MNCSFIAAAAAAAVAAAAVAAAAATALYQQLLLQSPNIKSGAWPLVAGGHPVQIHISGSGDTLSDYAAVSNLCNWKFTAEDDASTT
jgi:hypothetical protein